MTINELMQQIEETERLIAVYRNANEVIVGTQDEVYSRRGLINRTTLTAAEIGDHIVRILERRLATMRAELQKLGVPYRATISVKHQACSGTVGHNSCRHIPGLFGIGVPPTRT